MVATDLGPNGSYAAGEGACSWDFSNQPLVGCSPNAGSEKYPQVWRKSPIICFCFYYKLPFVTKSGKRILYIFSHRQKDQKRGDKYNLLLFLKGSLQSLLQKLILYKINFRIEARDLPFSV